MRQGSVLALVLLATAVLCGSAQNVTPLPCEGVTVRTAEDIVDAVTDSTLPDVNICVDRDVIGCAPCLMPPVSFCQTASVESHLVRLVQHQHNTNPWSSVSMLPFVSTFQRGVGVRLLKHLLQLKRVTNRESVS